MYRLFSYVFLILIFSGCLGDYRFSYPRENRSVSSSFLANSDYILAASPAPEIALYNTAADNGRNRSGVVCYVPTQLESVVDAFGPKIWKHEFLNSVEYEVIVKPAIEADKFEALYAAISSANPGITPTLVPCEILLNAVDIPGTLDGVRIRFSSYYSAGGDLFWIVRLRATYPLAKQLEALMKSQTGLVIPTQATVQGVNLPIAPPIEIKAGLPVLEE